MPVSNPPTLSSVMSVFGGSTPPKPLSSYVRGGAYVPSNAAAAISTTNAGLALSQFAGTSQPVTATVNPTSLASSGSAKGTITIGTVTVTAASGSGTYTYSAATIQSGANTGTYTTISSTQNGAAYTMKATMSQNQVSTVHGVWGVTVSDGSTSTLVTFAVNWN